MWVLLLLVAWAAVLLSCARLCHAALSADRPPDGPVPAAGELPGIQTAFLSGGPARAVEYTLVSMALQRRVLLAHTGWVTVVDPEGRDGVERGVLNAIGPHGQARIADVRAAPQPALEPLAAQLSSAGLAVGERSRSRLIPAIRQVRASAVGVLAAGLLGELLREGGQPTLAPHFAAPLLLALGALAVARGEGHRAVGWSTPEGRAYLTATSRLPGEADALGALALRGPSALPEPQWRAAFGGDRYVRAR